MSPNELAALDAVIQRDVEAEAAMSAQPWVATTGGYGRTRAKWPMRVARTRHRLKSSGRDFPPQALDPVCDCQAPVDAQRLFDAAGIARMRNRWQRYIALERAVRDALVNRDQSAAQELGRALAALSLDEADGDPYPTDLTEQADIC